MCKSVNGITRFIIIQITILLTWVVMAVPVSAMIQLPHAFYGNITINGEPAPIGTKVEARGQGIRTGISGNPILTSEVGKYGSESALGVKLIVQGDEIEGNPTIYFYINDHQADQTYTWKSEEITRLDLSVTIPVSTGYTDTDDGTSSDGTPSAGTNTLQYSLFGEESNVSISDTGEIQESIEIASTLPSGQVTINIAAGTVALDIDGNPLSTLTSDVDSSPPPAPEDYSIYMACDFGPDCATFDPPIVLTFDYDPADLPENTDEENLVIAFYDSSTGEWVLLDSEVDTVNHTITASASHFTTFSILVSQVEPTTSSATTPPELPDSISGEEPSPAPPAPEPEESPAPAPTSPEPAPEEAPPSPQASPSPEDSEPNDGWNLFIVIPAVIVGGVLIAILIRWTIWRERKQQ